jgi:hypothetical protein
MNTNVTLALDESIINMIKILSCLKRYLFLKKAMAYKPTLFLPIHHL